ncbi:MAG: sugar phosphate isomerase/epimerase, partial [Prevotella sp.]|nr:sugar phosphate isomerase/epimerase [Prevotella sp.]
VMEDYMIKHTDPNYLFFQMDVYWAVRGQVSPVAYFKKYPGRFTLLHIKDDNEIGQSGMVGFDAIFNNFDVAGAKGWVLELEHASTPDIMKGMKESIEYIKNAKFVKASYNK